MITKKLLGPLNLSKAQTFCIHKLTTTIMIYKYQNWGLTAFQIVMPGFQSFNQSWKLTVVGFIPSFDQKHLF